MAAMPDTRSHRGAHPEDPKDFAPTALPRLCAATLELSFLMSRDYASESALKLVGDHHQLTKRQRTAVQRGSCGDGALAGRKARQLAPSEWRGRGIAVDGFNCLITVESWLSGAPLFRGRDGALRDLASVHGTYRSVVESERAAEMLTMLLREQRVSEVLILLDRPVGNSGRTRALLERAARRAGLAADVQLNERVDATLVESQLAVASSDSFILDRAPAWLDLPAALQREGGGWLVELAPA